MRVDYRDCWENILWGDSGWFFTSPTHSCPFCNIELHDLPGPWSQPEVVEKYREFQRRDQERLLTAFSVRGCSGCDWWEVYHVLRDLERPTEWSRGRVVQSVIKSIDLAAPDEALDEIAKYVRAHPDALYHIHHRKMEELVGAVLSSHFGCEVKYVGQSHDGGTDLLLLVGNELVPVQVKRRQRPGKVESVKVVRELMGVMFRDQRRSAVLVTTADRFTREAKKEVAGVVRNRLAETFELIAFSEFADLVAANVRSPVLTAADAVPIDLGGKANTA